MRVPQTSQTCSLRASGVSAGAHDAVVAVVHLEAEGVDGGGVDAAAAVAPGVDLRVPGPFSSPSLRCVSTCASRFSNTANAAPEIGRSSDGWERSPPSGTGRGRSLPLAAQPSGTSGLRCYTRTAEASASSAGGTPGRPSPPGGTSPPAPPGRAGPPSPRLSHDADSKASRRVRGHQSNAPTRTALADSSTGRTPAPRRRWR